MPKKAVFLSILLSLYSLVPLFSQEDRTFFWSMCLQNIRTTEFMPFFAPVQSSTGERFYLIMRFQHECYCYIISENSPTGEMIVAYTGQIAGNKFFNFRFELTPPGGSESIFIITSRVQLGTLEQRIAAFNTNSGMRQRRALMNEIQNLRRDASRFTETPEKPVLMGGAGRTVTERDWGVEYSGSELYIKTISINH